MFNSVFANNSILSCFFLFFLSYWLILFNYHSYSTIFPTTTVLPIAARMPTKEKKDRNRNTSSNSRS